MEWYQVTKTIGGRRYLYWQKTYRVGSSVKTLNRYIGPAANPMRMRSLAAQMQNLPDAHKKLRADFDAGKITKTEYLETLVAKPTTTQYERTVVEHREHIQNYVAPPKEPEKEYRTEPRRADFDDEAEWRKYLREKREQKREYDAAMKKQTAVVRKAKRETRGIQSLNPFIAKFLKK